MTTSILRTNLRQRLTAAMRERDRPAVNALRSVLAALDNAEAVPVASGPAAASEHVAGASVGLGAGEAARRELTVADEREVVEREIAEMRGEADDADLLGAADRAGELRRVADIVRDVSDAGEPRR